MFEVNPRLIFAIVFVTALSLFMWRDRENVERHFILFYRRTEHGLEYIDAIAKKFPRFWKVYGSLGVVVGLLSLVVITGFTGMMFVDMVATQTINDGFALVLPGLESSDTGMGMDEPEAGAMFVPVEYWVIAIAVLMFVHEMSHGIVARIEGFEINSVGWIVLGIIPGAFVEPKGENMLPGGDSDPSESHTIWEGGGWKSRLKVLCAGSFANYVTAAVFFLLLLGLSTGVSSYAIQETEHLNYQAVEGYPAYEAGMTQGELYEVNGVEIGSVEDLRNATADIAPGDEVVMNTSEGEFTLETVERDGFDGGYIGIGLGNVEWKESFEPYQGVFQWFTSLLFVVGSLNLFIGLFNMLPIKPLDGGLSVETLITEFWGEDKVTYLNRFSLIGWALILGTITLALVL